MYTLTVEISNFGAVVLSLILLCMSLSIAVLFREIQRLRRAIRFMASVFTQVTNGCNEIHSMKQAFQYRYNMLRSFVIERVTAVNDWLATHSNPDK